MAYNRKELKVISTAEKKKNPYSKDVILDPMGQWKYPGQVTKIPFNQITMDGVPYPVLGIDDLGNEQMMYPGLDYTFPGQSVTEYPQMDEEEMRYGGLRRKPRRKTHNPAVGINDLMLRNPQYHTRKGAHFVPYKEEGGSTGGWLDKYQTGKAVTPTDSLKHQAAKTMDYEYTKGSATGTGLSNYGNPALGPNSTKEQAVNWYMQNIAPKLGHFKTAMEKGEAGDFLYNSGKDARIYAYQEYLRKTDPQNKTGWQDASGNWKDRKVLPKDFDTIYDNSVGKLPENDRRIKVNQGRDWYYKNINNPSPGVPSPAYDATWHDRINEAVNTYQGGGATATDSLNVYNNAIQLKGFYDKLSPYYKKPKVGEMSNYHTEKIKSGEIQKKTLGHEDVTEANKNIIRANTDPNIQYFSDLVTGAIDPNAPLMRYDRRIKPQGVIDYKPKSPFHDVLMNKGLTDEDAYSAESFFSTSSGPVEDSFNKEKIEELSKQTKISTPVLQALYKNQEKISDSLPGFITTIPYYDPTEVKPWYLRTPQEKIDFAKKHSAKPIKKAPAVKPSVINSSVVSDTQKIIQEIKKIVATAPIPKKPTGPTKYQTVSKTGQRYYFVDNQPVDSEDKYNAAKATEIDRETGAPVEKGLVKDKFGGSSRGWLDKYK